MNKILSQSYRLVLLTMVTVIALSLQSCFCLSAHKKAVQPGSYKENTSAPKGMQQIGFDNANPANQ